MEIQVLKPWLAHRGRKAHTVCDTVVLHATAGSTLESAVDTLRERGLSYHYIISQSGLVTKCVPAAAVAFHAGESEGPQGPVCNEYTVGVSFVNMNDGHHPYTAAQTEAAADLIAELKKQLPLRYLTTHYWIAPERKDDPLGYPVHALAERTGLEIWEP